MDAGAVIRQKMDFILVDAADRLGIEIGDARRTELRKVAYTLGDALPEEFLGLGALLRWVEDKGEWPRITSEHPAYFYTFRAAPGPDRDLVNMLLAELSPMDVRQMFIVHKELFYASYARWSDRKSHMWPIFWSGSTRWMPKACGRRCSGQSRGWTRNCAPRRRRQGIWGRLSGPGVR